MRGSNISKRGANGKDGEENCSSGTKTHRLF